MQEIKINKHFNNSPESSNYVKNKFKKEEFNLNNKKDSMLNKSK